MSTNFDERFYQLFENAKPYNYIWDSIVLTAAGLSIFVNGSLLRVIFKNKWSKLKIDMKLATIMIIFDTGSAVIAIINSASNFAHSNWYINSNLSCNLNALIILGTFVTSTSMVGVISLERCLLIVYKREYSEKFYYGVFFGTYVINMIAWLQSWFNHGFNMLPVSADCLFDVYTIGGIVGALLTGASMGVSLTFIFVGYTMICLYRREQSKKAQLELGLDPEKVRKEVNSTIIKSLTILFVSAMTNDPYTVLFIIQLFNPSFLNPLTDMFGGIFINMNLLLNSAILINMKPELWKEIKIMYGFSEQ